MLMLAVPGSRAGIGKHLASSHASAQAARARRMRRTPSAGRPCSAAVVDLERVVAVQRAHAGVGDADVASAGLARRDDAAGRTSTDAARRRPPLTSVNAGLHVRGRAAGARIRAASEGVAVGRHDRHHGPPVDMSGTLRDKRRPLALTRDSGASSCVARRGHRSIARRSAAHCAAASRRCARARRRLASCQTTPAGAGARAGCAQRRGRARTAAPSASRWPAALRLARARARRRARGRPVRVVGLAFHLFAESEDDHRCG